MRAGLHHTLETGPTSIGLGCANMCTYTHAHTHTHTPFNRRSSWQNPLAFLEREILLNTARRFTIKI